MTITSPLNTYAVSTTDLTASYGNHAAISDVDLQFPTHEVTALIGPSGCGKSTLLRCLNGMHLTVPKASLTGSVTVDGNDLYASHQDMVQLRQRVGMVFQRPTPFPTMTVFDNVAAGLRLKAGRLKRPDLEDTVERSLRQSGLWVEVKDRLHRPGGALSGGQQQRLCIARALAVGPTVLLMDEPCSALDPISTFAIEETIAELKTGLTIIIVTHNMQQATRVSDYTAFFTVDAAGKPGRLVEAGRTADLFANPREKETERYVTGKFG